MLAQLMPSRSANFLTIVKIKLELKIVAPAREFGALTYLLMLRFASLCRKLRRSVSPGVGDGLFNGEEHRCS